MHAARPTIGGDLVTMGRKKVAWLASPIRLPSVTALA